MQRLFHYKIAENVVSKRGGAYLFVRNAQMSFLAEGEIWMSSGNCNDFSWSMILPEKINQIYIMNEYVKLKEKKLKL